MRKPEKRILQLVGLAFALVVVFTIYSEWQYQARHPAKAGRPPPAAPAPPAFLPVGLNPADLPEPDSRGATLLTLYCAQCHRLPAPAMHSPEEWEAILDRMEDRMRTRSRGMLARVLMPGERDWGILRRYLARHAQRPLDAGAYPDLDSPEGRDFLAACSGCHGPPDPAQHTAAQWPRVVARMRMNMRQAGRPEPPPAALEKATAFLVRHAAP